MLQRGERFFLLGLSFKKAHLHIREAFSLSHEAIRSLLTSYKTQGGLGLFCISTCNRTEIYGFAKESQSLQDLFLEHSKGNFQDFLEVGYIKEDQDAIDHLFRVGSGLESQIVGDFQIIGQVKQGYELSREMGCNHVFIERLLHLVIKSSKRIKNETGLSSGSTSLAYAAVQFIRNQESALKDSPQILLYGTGKIGRATCDNLFKKFPEAKVTLINRTRVRAEELAMRYPVQVESVENLPRLAQAADVIVVATGAESATLEAAHLGDFSGKKLLIDLSVPRNIAPELAQKAGVELIDVNGLAAVINSDVSKRKTEIPKAEGIVAEVQEEFQAWLKKRQFAPTLNAIRENLTEIKTREIRKLKSELPSEAQDQVDVLTDRIIQKITRQVALHLHKDPDVQEHSIKTIESIFSLGEESKAS